MRHRLRRSLRGGRSGHRPADPNQPSPGLPKSAPPPPAAEAPCPAQLSDKPQNPLFAKSFRTNNCKGAAKQWILSSLESVFTKKWGAAMQFLTFRCTYVLWTASPYCHEGLPGSRFGKRLDRCVHEELTVQLCLVPRSFALHGKQARRERLVPLHGQAGHVADDERELLCADITRERHGIKTRAAHRAVAQQGVDGNTPFAPALREPRILEDRQHQP